MSDIVDIEQWLLHWAKQFEDQQAPRNLVEGLRTAAGAITQLRDEVQTWIVHANNAIWSDSEECKLLSADNERLRAALRTVDMLNDNPACYNSHIDDVVKVAFAPEKPHA